MRRSGAGESFGVTRYQWPSSIAAFTAPSERGGDQLRGEERCARGAARGRQRGHGKDPGQAGTDRHAGSREAQN